MQTFPLIDQYLNLILDMDLSGLQAGACAVHETPRRLVCEPSYGFVHALYGIFFNDGRAAFSVTPGARQDVLGLLEGKAGGADAPFDTDWLDALKACTDQARARMSLPPVQRHGESKVFACSRSTLRCQDHHPARPLHDESIPAAEGIFMPNHCFPDGIVYGVVEDGMVVSVAYAHRTRKMEDRVADLGVETAAAYRKKGYARAAVYGVTAQMIDAGGEAIYTCHPENMASIATASSVGYVPYARTLALIAPAPEE